jgi:hypothetical protein
MSTVTGLVVLPLSLEAEEYSQLPGEPGLQVWTAKTDDGRRLTLIEHEIEAINLPSDQPTVSEAK